VAKPGAAIAVHGGAYAIADADREAHRRGCHAALEAGLEVLESGGAAVDAVEAAVIALEDDETFDAGYGSHLTAAGGVEMDAALMDGAAGRIGSVACLSRIRNPITVARLVMESDLSMLVGDGALQYAAARGLPLCSPEDLISPGERRRWASNGLANSREGWQEHYFGDTVGAVALDHAGNLAAATSTGGTPSKIPGRVGDSPIIGSGLYADRRGAVSVSGYGERIAQVVWAKHIVDVLDHAGSMAELGEVALQTLRDVGGRGGFILLDAEGRGAVHWNSAAMAFALKERDSDTILDGPAERRRPGS
jgi:beta-aspartyl-peptidase (threonine type)